MLFATPYTFRNTTDKSNLSNFPAYICTPKYCRWLTHFMLRSPILSSLYHHQHNRFTALFPGPPGWAGARRELLDFMVQGEINRGRHTHHPAGRHSIRTNQCPPQPSPIFFTGRIPFLTPNQQRQSTEGKFSLLLLQCFDAVGWAAGRASGL